MTEPPKPKQKALCVATRCTNVDQFVATFHRFCDDSSFFVATLATRPVGLETAFSIQLEDKTPVLRGLCSVVEAWATPANRFGRPGVRLAVKRLTNESIVVFRQLQTARKAAEAAEAAGVAEAATPSGKIQVVDTTPPSTVPISGPIATATVPSSPDTAAAFAALKITALAPAKADPTPVPTAVAKADPTPVPSTTAKPAKADPTPVPSTTAKPAKADPTPVPSAIAKPAKADPTPVPSTTAKPAKADPTPVPSAIAKPAKSDPTPVPSRPTPTPPKLPPLRPVPSAATPPPFPVFPVPTGAPPPLPSVRADATPIPSLTARAEPAPAPISRVEPAPQPAARVEPAPQPAARVEPAVLPAARVEPAPQPAPRVEPAPAPAAPAPPSPQPPPQPAARVEPAPAPAAPAPPSPQPPPQPAARVEPAHAPAAPAPPSPQPAPQPAARVEPAHAARVEPAPAPAPPSLPPAAAAPPEPSPPPAPPERAVTEGPAQIHDSPPPRDYVPEPIAASDDLTNPVASETRTPGSSFVLPANPLMNLTDKSLEGFVDCALYEETGNFFRAPEYEDSLVDIDDVIAQPPTPARPGPRTLAPVSVLRPNAFVPAPEDHDFAPELTPLPQLAGIVPQRAETDPPIPPTPRGGRAPTPPVYDENAGMFYPPGSSDETGVGLRPPPTAPPPLGPPPGGAMAMQPAYARATPTPPLDSTAALIAVNQKRARKRWLVIGGAAAATSLLLLVIVLASGGDRGAQSADAATSTAPHSTPAAGPEATTKPPEPKPEVGKPEVTRPAAGVPSVAKPEAPVPDEPEVEPSGDPNAPPVVGSGPCRVTVNSSPAGSMVSIDDQQVGPSPITIAGPCAKRRVDVKHPRYALGTKWVMLAAGKPASIDLALSRPTHSVTVTSTPSGATVSIAGRRAGTTPTAVKVMGFTGVTLTVEKKGYRTESQKLYSKVDGERLTIKLVKGK